MARKSGTLASTPSNTMSSSPVPSSVAPDARRVIAAQLGEALRHKRRDFNALCSLGGAAMQLGMSDEAGAAFGATVAILLEVIRAGDAEGALAAHNAIYHAFVRSFQIQDHYYRSFAHWRDAR